MTLLSLVLNPCNYYRTYGIHLHLQARMHIIVFYIFKRVHAIFITHICIYKHIYSYIHEKMKKYICIYMRIAVEVNLITSIHVSSIL